MRATKNSVVQTISCDLDTRYVLDTCTLINFGGMNREDKPACCLPRPTGSLCAKRCNLLLHFMQPPLAMHATTSCNSGEASNPSHTYNRRGCPLRRESFAQELSSASSKLSSGILLRRFDSSVDTLASLAFSTMSATICSPSVSHWALFSIA